MTSEKSTEKSTDVTEAGEALHGDQAVEEKYPQPDAVTLDASTRVATDAPGHPEFAEQLDRREGDVDAGK